MRKRKKFLPPPRPPTTKELCDIRERKENADYDMAYFDDLSPNLRAACRKYACAAWQIAGALERGYPESAIIAALQRENGEL